MLVTNTLRVRVLAIAITSTISEAGICRGLPALAHADVLLKANTPRILRILAIVDAILIAGIEGKQLETLAPCITTLKTDASTVTWISAWIGRVTAEIAIALLVAGVFRGLLALTPLQVRLISYTDSIH